MFDMTPTRCFLKWVNCYIVTFIFAKIKIKKQKIGDLASFNTNTVRG